MTPLRLTPEEAERFSEMRQKVSMYNGGNHSQSTPRMTVAAIRCLMLRGIGHRDIREQLHVSTPTITRIRRHMLAEGLL